MPAGTPPHRYGALRALAASAAAQLKAIPVVAANGAAARVALVLPATSPELATAFLAVASFACAVPINPAFTEKEVAFAVGDMGAHAIVALATNAAAKAVASSQGLPFVALTPRGAAGEFDLAAAEGGGGGGKAGGGGAIAASPDNVCLLVHTSGSTSKPKKVLVLNPTYPTSSAPTRQRRSQLPFKVHAVRCAIAPPRQAYLTHVDACESLVTRAIRCR